MKLNLKIVKNNLLLIIILSLTLRVLNLYFFEGIFLHYGEDDEHYFKIASYVEENGLLNWQSIDRPPLISLIIVPIIKIFNYSFSLIFIKLLMIFLSISTCISLYFLSLEITKSYKISFLISLIYSFYPFSIYMSGRLYTENLATLLICLISLFFIKFINKHHIKFLLIVSFLMGLLSLTRSSYFYLPFFLSFTILLINKNIIKKLLYISTMFLIFFMTLSPWIIKNYFQLNEYVPTTTRLGYGLWLSNNDFSNKTIKNGGYERTEKFKEEIEYSKSFDPIKKSNYLKEKALKEIKNNKLEFVKACIFRFLNFFNPKPNPYKKFTLKDMVMITFFSPFLVIFFLSLINKNYNFEKIILLTIIFYALVTHIPFYGMPRFRFPVDGLIFLLAVTYLFENTNSKSFLKFLSRLKFFRE